MITEVTGLVLSLQDYREKDVLVKIATKEHGVMTLVAKSLRAITSKNAGSCMPFMESNFMIDFQEQRTMHVLTGAQVVKTHRQLREDLNKQAFATYICDSFGYLMQLNEESSYYEELVEVLEVLEQTMKSLDGLLCFALFLARLCHFFGIEPYVDGCVSCGGERGICTVSIQDGGFICADCVEPMMNRYSKEMLYLFRLLMKASYEHLPKLVSSEETVRGVVMFLFEFIKEHTSFTPVSEKFIKDILHL